MDLSNVLEIVRLTDIGLIREHNEDAIASDDVTGVVVLADGMGGYNAGEVASEIAVLSIIAEIKVALTQQYLDQACTPLNMDVAAQLLRDAINTANKSIYNVSQSHSQFAGMGTTLVVGLFLDNKILVGHIGDSRMYRLRKQTFKQMTEDHSLLQEQLRAGLISPDQARYSIYKNLVTRALGVDLDVELELNQFDVEIGDIYLLCSDGLTDLVEDHLIQSTLIEYSTDLTKAAHALIQIANHYGGKDNISVILVHVNKSFEYKLTWVDSVVSWLR